MAKIIQIDRKNPRRKKWEHFKLRFRFYLLRISILTNIYFLYKLEFFNYILDMVNK